MQEPPTRVTTGHNGHHLLFLVTFLVAPKALEAKPASISTCLLRWNTLLHILNIAWLTASPVQHCFFCSFLFVCWGICFYFVLYLFVRLLSRTSFFSCGFIQFQKAALTLGSFTFPSLLLQMVLLSCNSKIFGCWGQQVINKLVLVSFSSQSGTRVEMHLLWTSFSH